MLNAVCDRESVRQVTGAQSHTNPEQKKPVDAAVSVYSHAGTRAASYSVLVTLLRKPRRSVKMRREAPRCHQAEVVKHNLVGNRQCSRQEQCPDLNTSCIAGI